MKNFKFKVKKTIENTVELKAESYQEAIINLFELFITADKEIFEKSKDKEVGYDILFDNLDNQKELETIKNIKEFLADLEENDDDFEEEIEQKIDENEDDFDTKITKIVCRKRK